MSNATMTIIKVFGIVSIITIFWYFLICIFYFLVATFIGIEFDIKVSFLLFGAFIAFRMFYPKNVFK